MLKKCSALIFPSTWFEGMPMTILEAFSLGTAVIASNIGAMETMITPYFNGLHFEVNKEQDLIDKLLCWDSFSEISKESYYSNAYSTFQNNYTPEINLQKFIKIYKNVLS